MPSFRRLRRSILVAAALGAVLFFFFAVSSSLPSVSGSPSVGRQLSLYFENLGDRIYKHLWNTDRRPSSLITGDGLRYVADHFCDDSPEAGYGWLDVLFEPNVDGKGVGLQPCKKLRENPRAVRRRQAVFVKVDYLAFYLREIAPRITEKHVVVAHNGDVAFGRRHLELLQSASASSVGALFVQNIEVGIPLLGDRLHSVPIGLENRFYRAGGCFQAYVIRPRHELFGFRGSALRSSAAAKQEKADAKSAISANAVRLGKKLLATIREGTGGHMALERGPLILGAFTLSTNVRERSRCFASLKRLNQDVAATGTGNQAALATLRIGKLADFSKAVANAEEELSKAASQQSPLSWERLKAWAAGKAGNDQESVPFVASLHPSDVPADLQGVKKATDDCPFPQRGLFPFTGEGSDDDRRVIQQNFEAMASHPFVVSPAGNGIQSHRTWEALFAGTVPIVASASFQTRPLGPGHLLPSNPLVMSPMDEDLYTGLPVLIIHDWPDLTEELLLGSAIRLAIVAENTALLESCRSARLAFLSKPESDINSQSLPVDPSLSSLLELCVKRGLLVTSGQLYSLPNDSPPLLDPRLLAVSPDKLTEHQRLHLERAVFSFDRLYLSFWLSRMDALREASC